MIWNQKNFTLYRLLQGILGSLSKRSSMPIGIGIPEQLGEKEELKNLELSG